MKEKHLFTLLSVEAAACVLFCNFTAKCVCFVYYDCCISF